MDLIRFAAMIPVTVYHVIREKYYETAYRHSVKTGNPDATLLCVRMLVSRQRVGDFLRGIE